MNDAELRQLFEEYKLEINCGDDRIKEFYENLNSIEEAIHYGANAQIPNKHGKLVRHDHLRCIRKKALPKLEKILMSRKRELSQCKLISEIMTILEDAKVFGIGEMAVYDISCFIGYFLKISPKKVYLHTGVRKGAKKLGLDTSKGYIEMNNLPEPLKEENPEEIENFLCIKKDEFSKYEP